MRERPRANSALVFFWLLTERVWFGVAWLATALLLVLLPGCSMKQDMSMAQRAVNEFHASLKAHKEGDVAVDVSPRFYQSVDVGARRAYLARIRSTLGAPLSSSPINVHVDHMPAGTFLSARYRTHFEHGDAQEDFSWQVENGRPYLVAYAVTSPVLAQ